MAIDDRCKLFVAGLPDSISEPVLRQLFEATGGTVVDISVPKDRATGRPRGFAFVTLSTEEEARRAREDLDGSLQSGRSISVRPFQAGPAKRDGGGPGPRPDGPPDRGGGGGGGGGGAAEDRTLYLGNLPYDTTVQEIEQLFARAGVSPVVRVNLPVDPTGRPRGFGFVVLGTTEAVQTAMEALRDAELKGRRISASVAHARGTGPRPIRSGPPMGGPAPGRAPWSDGPRWAPEAPPDGGGAPPGEEGDDRRRRGAPSAKDKKKKKGPSAERSRTRRDGEGLRAPRARDRFGDDDDE